MNMTRGYTDDMLRVQVRGWLPTSGLSASQTPIEEDTYWHGPSGTFSEVPTRTEETVASGTGDVSGLQVAKCFSETTPTGYVTDSIRGFVEVAPFRFATVRVSSTWRGFG